MEVADSDEELVMRIAEGDERALAELHRRYAPHLTALARRMLTRTKPTPASRSPS